MKYQEPLPITREDVNKSLASRDSRAAAEALIRMALCESDWEWAEHVCLTALKDDRAEVKVAALTALGHLARRFRTLHLDVVLPSIKNLLMEAPYRGAAEDALDDIAVFIRI
jgi:hypothetical protein